MNAEAQQAPRTVTAADIEPRTMGWRVQVAIAAHQVFRAPQLDAEIAAAVGKEVDDTVFEPYSIADFSKFLNAKGLRDAGNAVELTRLLAAMEHAGLLLAVSPQSNLPFMGQRYIAQGGASPGQLGGNLWLSQIFGAELIIPSYKAVTMQICVNDAAGNPTGRWGTGLVLDHNHILTNRHVAAAVKEAGPRSTMSVNPSSDHANTEQVNCACTAHLHQELDVAVLEAKMPENKGFTRLLGMAFREPDWADEVFVFGYPNVPMVTEMVLTVQRGEVVNPATETPAGGGLPRQKTFLYSAIARPGNSGGPIVAQDGRVIGLVVEDSSAAASASAATQNDPPPRWSWERLSSLEREVAELRAKAFAPAFYRGIPSGEVIKALNDLELSGLARLDDPPPGGTSFRFNQG